MAIKIPVAFDLIRCKKVTAKELEDNGALIQSGGQYRCVTESCGALLGFVRKSTRNINGKDVDYSPFFRLRKGNVHQNCPSVPQQMVKIIAKKSVPGLLDESKEGVGSVLRLHKVFDRLIQLPVNVKDPSISSEDDEMELPQKVTEILFENKGKMLSYISQAKHIASVYHQLQESGRHKELEVFLLWKGRDLEWKDFIFNHDEYPRLWRRIHPKNSIDYPIALNGVLMCPIRAQKQKYELQMCIQKEIRYVPTLRINPALAEKLELKKRVGQEVIILGNLLSPTFHQSDGKPSYGWIPILVSKPSQIAFLSGH